MKIKLLHKKAVRTAFVIITVLAFCCSYFSYKVVKNVLMPSVSLNGEPSRIFYVKTGSNLSLVLKDLINQGFISDTNGLKWTADKKSFKTVKPGRYVIYDNWNNNQLINILRSGSQEPVSVTFNNIRTLKSLAGKVGKQIEADSTALINAFNDIKFIKQYGFSKYSFPSMFLSNTYEFYWNTSATQFIEKMNDEYDKYWSEERKLKLSHLNLTPNDITTIASIIEKESNVNEELPRIAGVYINRLKNRMPLQADPTLVFASGKFDTKRVTNDLKKIDSPYNTYMYKGLPPGPICLPSIKSINAVLNFEEHKYLYFCASDDLSGKHLFATSYAKHLINARKFQRKLNELKIYK